MNDLHEALRQLDQARQDYRDAERRLADATQHVRTIFADPDLPLVDLLIALRHMGQGHDSAYVARVKERISNLNGVESSSWNGRSITVTIGDLWNAPSPQVISTILTEIAPCPWPVDLVILLPNKLRSLRPVSIDATYGPDGYIDIDATTQHAEKTMARIERERQRRRKATA